MHPKKVTQVIMELRRLLCLMWYKKPEEEEESEQDGWISLKKRFVWLCCSFGMECW